MIGTLLLFYSWKVEKRIWIRRFSSAILFQVIGTDRSTAIARIKCYHMFSSYVFHLEVTVWTIFEFCHSKIPCLLLLKILNYGTEDTLKHLSDCEPPHWGHERPGMSEHSLSSSGLALNYLMSLAVGIRDVEKKKWTLNFKLLWWSKTVSHPCSIINF